MHREQQSMKGLMESVTSMLGTMTTQLRDAMIEQGVFKALATKRIDHLDEIVQRLLAFDQRLTDEVVPEILGQLKAKKEE
jgi:hypothetical protein